MKKGLLIGLFLVAAAVMIKLLLIPRPDAGAPKGAARKGGGSLTAQVIRLAPNPIVETITSTGTIVAAREVDIKAEASGRIIQYLLKEGTSVKKGALLVLLNDAELQAQLTKASAVLTLAQQRENRQKALLEKQVIGREEYEIATRDLASAQAEVQLIRAQIDKTRITAPFDGVVGLSPVELGGYVTPGARIVTIVAPRPAKVEFSVPERLSGALTSGSRLQFTIEGSARQHAATVTAMEPRIDESTRTLKVQAQCTDDDAVLVPGTFAYVTMTIRKNEHAIAIPTEALVPDAQGYKVFVVKGGKAAAMAVIPGIRQERFVEILQGLAEGDSLMTTGLLVVRPGMKIEVRGESERRKP